jgi:hypothetical protein
MRMCFLAAMMTLAMMTLGGCGGDSDTAPSGPFELQGTWLYLGPGDRVHTIEVSNASMAYTDIGGEWSSDWTIKGYDNGLDHFQIAFKSGTGTYLPEGQSFSGTYVWDGAILVVQLTDGLGSYSPVQSPSCIKEGSSTLIPNCGRYMKEN